MESCLREGEPIPKRQKMKTRGEAKAQAIEQERNFHFDPKEPSMDILSEDVLLSVLTFLDLKTRCRLQTVSKKWSRVFVRSVKALKTYDYREIFGYHHVHTWEAMIGVLKYCQKLQVLKVGPFLSSRQICQKEVIMLRRYCPGIISMDFSMAPLSPNGVVSLGKFAFLERLDLSRAVNFVKLSGDRFKKAEANLRSAFSCLKNLKWLNLRQATISGTSLAGLNREKLEFLDISNCTFNLTGSEAFLGEKWSALTELVASNFRIIHPPWKDCFMKQLVGKAPKLFSLDVTNACERTTSGLQFLVQLENFRELRAGHVDDTHTSAYLAALASNSDCAGRIDFLDLIPCTLNDQAMSSIQNLAGLIELRLSPSMIFFCDSFFDQERLSAVCRGCRNLERLTLRCFSKLDDVCLASIGSYCARLAHLDCISCPAITNEGLQALAAGLRGSEGRQEGRKKVEIFVKGCTKIDPVTLGINDLWVSVNAVDVPALHRDLPPNSFPNGSLSEDEDEDEESWIADSYYDEDDSFSASPYDFMENFGYGNTYGDSDGNESEDDEFGMGFRYGL